MKYQVWCDDNFHFGGDGRWLAGEYATYEEAETECKRIVQQGLDEFFRRGQSDQETFERYAAFGEDASIVPMPEDKHFSAREYAKAAASGMFNPHLSERYDQALQFAAELHREQARKGSNAPYLSHLMAVSGLVMEYGGHEDQSIAALLHDALEDQSEKAGGAEKLALTILSRFGDAVSSMVDACTDSRGGQKMPWRERKEAYLTHLSSGQVMAPPDVFLVSSCDKLHNARCIVADLRKHGNALFDRFTGGQEGTLWYYRALVDVYRSIDAPTAVDELDLAVTEMERLAAVQSDA